MYGKVKSFDIFIEREIFSNFSERFLRKWLVLNISLINELFPKTSMLTSRYDKFIIIQHF